VPLWLPIHGEAQEEMVSFKSVFGVEIMQPLGDERNVLLAEIPTP
jgi:hypothetical protein